MLNCYSGRRQLLNCLISIYELFEDDDDRRILNELYITDYLVWVQQVHPETIKSYVQLIESVSRRSPPILITITKHYCE